MVHTDLKAIRYFSSTLLVFCLVFSSVSTINSQVDIGQDNEGCWHCHGDFYPDKTIDINELNFNCLNDPENPPPIDYSSLALGYTEIEFKTTPRYRGFNLSENFINSYSQSKKGHLSHLISQPFGLGRLCLDCHYSDRYSNWEWDPNDTDGSEAKPHPTDGNVYFKDGNTLNKTTICTQCHGGFYPKESETAPESVRVLEWGDPGSITCLQCHDDSDEHGGMYASYTTYYCSEFRYKVDCDITAPDPDRISGQNYWSKNGHGVTAKESFPGATLDTGYPNKGAMNNENIPTGLSDYPYIDFYNERSRAHDLNLDPDDGRKNFCWECHWSNERVLKTICANSSPLGKYNGHVDTEDYSFTDERWWGNLEEYDSTDEDDPYAINEHAPFDTCRSCHPAKYSHYYNYNLRNTNYWNCVLCHDPHGSGDENGNANVFMIRSMVVTCNNCHYSQLECPPCTTTFGFEKCGSWLPSYPAINFLDPLILDIPEPDSLKTADVCEVCHISLGSTEIKKALVNWPSPGGLADYKHRTGAGHYFNPNQDSCENPDDCKIDYRGTDCTGCHVHDPGPPPDPNDPTVGLDDTKVFNSKAFAPTCRCHGIERIDIATFTVDGNVPVDSKGKSLFGRGHGTPPPPFPGPDPDRRYNPDPHMAHAGYNFPCHRCHIDPDRPVNPNEDYIFSLDGNTPVGFDSINPEGIYKSDNKTCSNLYCHSNGREDGYAAPIRWDASEGFCIDGCPVDEYDGHFSYCDKCHHTPPDVTDFHSGLDKDRGCEVCHPHNGIYEDSRGGFYKHVNGQVDVKEVYCDDNTPEEVDKRCLECHAEKVNADALDLGLDSDKGWKHAAKSNCLDCHDAVCDDAAIEHYQFEEPLDLSIEENWDEKTGCGVCHNETNLIKETDKTAFSNIKASHANIVVDDVEKNCEHCHGRHYALDKIDGSQCAACHIPEKDVRVVSRREYLHDQCIGIACTDCHSSSHEHEEGKMKFAEGKSQVEIEYQCEVCHNTDDLDQITISCDLYFKNHEARENCLSCHDVLLTEEGNKIKKKHYRMNTNLGNMERAWSDVIDIEYDPENNHCGVCHDKKWHGLISLESYDVTTSACNDCHVEEKHCEIKILSPEWEGVNTCGSCHVEPTIPDDPLQGLHSRIPIEAYICKDCHGDNHRDSLHLYRDDPGKCIYCHGNGASFIINIECNETAKSGEHPAEAANCNVCHLEKSKHWRKDEADDLNLNIEQAWNDKDGLVGNECGVCHVDPPSLLYPDDNSKTLHSSVPVTLECNKCHGRHCDLNVDPDKCNNCHADTQIREDRYLHNQYTGLICSDCHTESHNVEEMTFTEGETQEDIEEKCKICHNDEDLKTISVSCNGQGEHKTGVNCLNCHDVFTKEGDIYKIKDKHYDPDIDATNLENMEGTWSGQDGLAGNHCGVCHEDGPSLLDPDDPSKKLHDLVTLECNKCHGIHCDLDNIDKDQCTSCHSNNHKRSTP